MEEIRALAGPIVQRHFEKAEEERQALQARLEAEAAAKKAADEEARKAAEAERAAQEPAKDEEMPDAEPGQAKVEEVDDEQR